MEERQIRTIGLLTGGGDCCGLNAAIRAVVLQAAKRGWTVRGYRNGWAGALDDDYSELVPEDVAEIIYEGGTMLGTSRTDPRRDEATYAVLTRLFDPGGIDALVAIGGDDTLSVAAQLAADGYPVVGAPKTMDNDVTGTNYCIGFHTAITRVTEAIDSLRTTARSHRRAIVVETMGRDAGWVAAYAGIAAGADFVLLPETETDVADVIAALGRRHAAGQPYALVVVSEGAKVTGLGDTSARVDERDQFGHELLATRRLAARLATAIGEGTPYSTREVVLGHTQRGGTVSAYDRVLGTRLGRGAVALAERGRWGHMPALVNQTIVDFPLDAAVGTNRKLTAQLLDVVEDFQ